MSSFEMELFSPFSFADISSATMAGELVTLDMLENAGAITSRTRELET